MRSPGPELSTVDGTKKSRRSVFVLHIGFVASHRCRAEQPQIIVQQLALEGKHVTHTSPRKRGACRVSRNVENFEAAPGLASAAPPCLHWGARLGYSRRLGAPAAHLAYWADSRRAELGVITTAMHRIEFLSH